MKDNVDDLIRQALSPVMQPKESLECDTIRRMTDCSGKCVGGSDIIRRMERRGMGWLRPVLAVLCAALLMGGAATAYAATNGLTLGELFVHIWTERSQKTSLESLGSDVTVLAEESTFQDIVIEPVRAISDSYLTYVVLKVEGRNGFHLTDEMAFDCISMENRQNAASGLNSFLLKREGNTMHVALQMSTLKIKNYRFQKISIKIHDLHHAILDEMGRAIRVKKMIRDSDYERYSEESIAAAGEYHVELVCTVHNEKTEIKTEDCGTFTVYSLGVFVDRDLSGRLEKLDEAEWENRGIFAILQDGREVQAVPSGGYAGISSVFELREPIDPDEVRGIRVQDQIYNK